MKIANLCATLLWDDFEDMPNENTDVEERWDGFGDESF
jgi:hypothetical protein